MESPEDLAVSDDYFLELSPEPLKFEPVNDVTEVFFDDFKQQVNYLFSKHLFLPTLCLQISSYFLGFCHSFRRGYRCPC